jgi:hypothetical protein
MVALKCPSIKSDVGHGKATQYLGKLKFAIPLIHSSIETVIFTHLEPQKRQSGGSPCGKWTVNQ